MTQYLDKKMMITAAEKRVKKQTELLAKRAQSLKQSNEHNHTKTQCQVRPCCQGLSSQADLRNQQTEGK